MNKISATRAMYSWIASIGLALALVFTGTQAYAGAYDSGHYGAHAISARSAFADCPCDMTMAARLVDRMPEGRQKDIAIREIQLAAIAPTLGVEAPCFDALGICVANVCPERVPGQPHTHT